MFKTKTILLLATMTMLTLISGCKKRSEVLIVQENTVKFEQAVIYEMPHLRYSEKRGFADLNCDGVEDMLEINDESSFFESAEEYNINFFEGHIENGETLYKKSKIIPIKIDLKWFVNAMKIDTADINGDGCADVVFTSVLSEYRKPTRLQIKVAFNMGDLTFITTEKNVKINTNDGHGFQYWFNELVKDIASDEDSSLSSYLKMDWADFDGNGTDDLALFVKEDSSLDIGIFYTEKTSLLQPTFSHIENFWVQNFLFGANVSGIDTGDINGDGLSDIIIEQYSKGETLKTGFAMNRGENFVINRDLVSAFGTETDLFSKARKRDMLDNNGDGKDDIIYITERDDKPIKIVFLSK